VTGNSFKKKGRTHVMNFTKLWIISDVQVTSFCFFPTTKCWASIKILILSQKIILANARNYLFLAERNEFRNIDLSTIDEELFIVLLEIYNDKNIRYVQLKNWKAFCKNGIRIPGSNIPRMISFKMFANPSDFSQFMWETFKISYEDLFKLCH